MIEMTCTTRLTKMNNIVTSKKLEKTYTLRVNEYAWNFYHDQCGPRIKKW